MALSNNMSKLRTNIPFWISLVLLVISLTQTAYTTDSKNDSDIPALLEFVTGWGAAIVCPPYFIPWLANPLLIISWIILGKKATISLFLSFLSVIFAASFLLFDKVPINEAPSYESITQIGTGYWFWLLSCISFFLGTYIIIVYNNFKLKKQL